MKPLLFLVIVALNFTSCAGGSADKSRSDSTSTASDTITNVTNPGVGAARMIR